MRDNPKTIQDIDAKIAFLKEKKETMQKREALLMLKEATKILADAYSPDLALMVLQDTWKNASEAQKKEWQNKASTFRQKSRTNDVAKGEKDAPQTTLVDAHPSADQHA